VKSITITLPWPSADLSPNGRVHWSTLARAKKKAKNEAWGLTKAIMGPLGIRVAEMAGPLDVQITFHPEIDRGRDVDNFQARMKAGLDGIALALGVNDTSFHPVTTFGAKRKPHCVVITLTQRGGNE
jgi:crossover junction endodeoxyribonuclease RusA